MDEIEEGIKAVLDVGDLIGLEAPHVLRVVQRRWFPVMVAMHDPETQRFDFIGKHVEMKLQSFATPERDEWIAELVALRIHLYAVDVFVKRSRSQSLLCQACAAGNKQQKEHP